VAELRAGSKEGIGGLTRWVLVGLAVLVVLLIGTQLVIPPIVSNQIEGRLTDEGGTASATVKAFPALRLLFHHGDKLDVEARGVDLRLTVAGGSLDKLDDFDEVNVVLDRTTIGPFTTDHLVLSRPEDAANYTLVFRGTTTAAGLSRYAASTLPPALGALVATLVDRTGRLGSGSIPIRIDAELKSENGVARVVSGSGTVAGLPVGPFALGIVGAIASRITS
jgi:hypothetical protein